MEQVQSFYTIERAVAQKKKTPRRCASYYYIDMDKIEAEGMIKGIEREKGKREKRKKFSN